MISPLAVISFFIFVSKNRLFVLEITNTRRQARPSLYNGRVGTDAKYFRNMKRYRMLFGEETTNNNIKGVSLHFEGATSYMMLDLHSTMAFRSALVSSSFGEIAFGYRIAIGAVSLNKYLNIRIQIYTATVVVSTLTKVFLLVRDIMFTVPVRDLLRIGYGRCDNC